MTVLGKAAQALRGSSTLTTLLAGGASGIYHGVSPDAGTYPVIVYASISDVPTLSADDELWSHRDTIRITIIDGKNSGKIASIGRAVYAAMTDAEFDWAQSQDYVDGDTLCRIMDFNYLEYVGG